MGMDVTGRDPDAEEGEYFRNNVWWWHPLANYIIAVAPAITASVEHWHSNDGDGLQNAEQAIRLADLLDAEIKSGRCKTYEDDYMARLKALPKVTCKLCNGKGIRTDFPDFATRKITEEGHPRFGKIGWCNGCDGHGDKKPWEAHYPFSVENVQEFSTFCRHSGGFIIG